MGSPNSSHHGTCILELKKAKNLRASKILGGKTKIHAVMRFQALSHTTKTIIGEHKIMSVLSADLSANSTSPLRKDTLELQPNGGFLTESSLAVGIISFRLCEDQDEFHKPTVHTLAPVEKNWYDTKLQISGHMVSNPGMFHCYYLCPIASSTQDCWCCTVCVTALSAEVSTAFEPSTGCLDSLVTCSLTTAPLRFVHSKGNCGRGNLSVKQLLCQVHYLISMMFHILGFLFKLETESQISLCLCWICVMADMGNNPVWEQEIFTLDISGCSDDTPFKIDIFKDGSKLIGSIVLTVLELCMVEGIPQPRNLPLVTARGKHHNEEVEILTTYLGVPNSAPTATMFSCPSPARGYYQATAPVWGLPYVSSMSSTSGIYQQSHSNQFQENCQSKVDLSDSEPQYPQLSQQMPSKPFLDQFYAYFG